MQTTNNWSPPNIVELWGLTRGDAHTESLMTIWANVASALAECGVKNHNLYITYQVLRYFVNPTRRTSIGLTNHTMYYVPFIDFFNDFIENEENKERLRIVVDNFLNVGRQLPDEFRWELGFD